MGKTSVTRLFGHLNNVRECKGNTVYLENVNFISLAGRDKRMLTTIEFISKKQFLFWMRGFLSF